MKEAKQMFVLGAGLPISMPILIIAGLVLAIVILIAAFLLFRSSGKKKAEAANASVNDWQSQAPQGAWGQQPQQQQQAGSWGAQPQPQQAGWGQSADNNAWGQQSQQQPQQAGWGAQNAAQPQPQQAGGWEATQRAGGWEAAAPVQQQSQQPQASGWEATQRAGGWEAAAPAQQQSQPQQQGWGVQGAASVAPQAANQWGAPAGTGSQPSWDAPAATQEPWGQQQQPQQPSNQSWGMQAPQQQAPASFGGGPNPSWNQQQGGFGAQSGSGSSWQQAGMGSNTPGMQQDATMFASDADKTVLRPSGAQVGAIGLVRVEEGKEPGRVYEVRKESLSIGRSRESDIFLEDLAVSRLHASIVNMGNGNYALKDEGSANGTKVNGQLVNKYQTYQLQDGDRIQLGQTVLVFGRR